MKRRYKLHRHHYPILAGKKILHSNSLKLSFELLRQSLSKHEELKVFFLTDRRREGLETLRGQLLEIPQFSDKHIKIICSDNVEAEREAIAGYAQGALDCDVLLASPSLNIGIRLNGLFDITVINCVSPERPHTSSEIMQMMTRDADCSVVIWQEKLQNNGLTSSPKNWLIPEPDWEEMTEKDWDALSKNIEKIYGSKTDFFERDPISNSYQPRRASLIKRTVKHHNWSIRDRENRLENTKALALSLGLERWFDLEETKELVCPAKLKELKLATPNYIREELHKRLLGELEASPDSLARLNEIAQDLRLDIKSQRLTEKQIAQWDNKNYLDNEERKRQLHSGASGDELGELVLKLLQLVGKDDGKMKILTDKQFKESSVFMELEENFARFQRFAQDQLGIYNPKKLDTELDALRWAGELLKKYGYYTEVKTEKETNPNRERANLYQQAKKEHLREFNRWAKGNKKQGSQVRYDDWLWFVLNDKNERAETRFKPKTRRYIQTFPHLKIEEYPERYSAHG